MKKVIAILLALCMSFALFACGGTESSSPSGSTSGAGNSGSSSPAGGGAAQTSGGPKELGFYDRDYDYTQHEKYRFAYLVSATGVMYDSFNQAFATWADRLNMEYIGIWAPAEATTEAFLAGLEQYCRDMGLDGILTDSDPALAQQISGICKKYNVVWMAAMAQGRDNSQPYTIMGTYSPGPLLAPNVGFNNIAVGRAMAEGLIAWKEKAHPDVPWEQVGFLSLDWSAVIQIHERTLGQKQVWAEKNPTFGTYDPDPTSELRNFFVADLASGATGADLTTQMLSDPPDPNIKVWLIAPPIWDYAAGAATAAENMGMIDNVAVTNFGSGASAIALWDAGVPTCIRFSLETASPVFAEAIANALWTMMAGLATPDTLWPEWQCIWDKGDVFQLSSDLDPLYQVPKVEIGADGTPVINEEHGYASMVLPMIWVDQDNYKEFYGWVDLYDLGPDAQTSQRTYPDYPLGTDINAFNARGTVPQEYSEWPSGQ